MTAAPPVSSVCPLKLYEDLVIENEKLKEQLQEAQLQLTQIKLELERVTQVQVQKGRCFLDSSGEIQRGRAASCSKTLDACFASTVKAHVYYWQLMPQLTLGIEPSSSGGRSCILHVEGWKCLEFNSRWSGERCLCETLESHCQPVA